MKKQTKKSIDAELIRRKAEALLKEKQSDKSVALTEIETLKLLYELEVHQIELEMQKEELQLAKEKAETNAEKYTNLYDYSPDGKFTLNSNGEICELNFNAAKMLNKERSKLINRNFKLFITSETRSIFIDFLDEVSNTKTKQSCEVRLVINENPSAFAYIEGVLLENKKNYLITVIDVSKGKQAEIELIKAKEKAVISEKYLDNIINYIGDPIFVKDENSILTLVNDAFCTLFEKERDDIIGKTLAEDVTPDEKEEFLKIDKQVLRTGEENINEESLTVKGKPTRTISTRKARYINPNNEKYLIGVIRDITKSKESEKELKEREKEHKSLISKMMNAFALHEIIYNAEGDAIDYKFLQVNPVWEKIVGAKSEMVVGKTIREIMPGIDDIWIERYNRIVETGISEEFEEYSDALGKYFYCYAYRTDPGKFAVIFNDTTEKNQAAKELKESEGRIRLFTQNVPDFLLQIDRAGKINYINKTLEGLTQKDVIGSSVYTWIPEEYSVKFKDKVGKVFKYGGSEIIEYPGSGLKGEPLWFESKIGPLEKSGIITQVIIVSRDITERKAAELDLKRALNENIELKQQIEAENVYLKEELKLDGSFNEIVGSSKRLKKTLKQVSQVAKTDTTVLILGETGTGKELIARAIHNASDRKDKPMVKVNCSALPAELVESEFFGHEIGAFTGAVKRKIGRFELAHGGTIFLDEIGDLPLGLQTRLLRVLQESEFERVGGEVTIKVDVRVITATNRNLKEEIVNGDFRQDLYYRLNVFPITCSALRDRIDDVPILVNHFVNKYSHKVNKKIKTINQKSLDRLMKYKWPGNVRELEHIIERAVILNEGGQLLLGNWFMDNGHDHAVPDGLTTLEIVERDYIIKVLEKTNWKIRGKNGAAEILGMQPTTLESRMKKRDIRR